MSVNSKMTAIADEIRVLSGTTEELGLDEMASNVADANTDVETMAGLIEELEAALEGKSVSGGETPPSIETVSVAIRTAFTPFAVIYSTVNEDGTITTTNNVSNEITVAVGTAVTLLFSQSIASFNVLSTDNGSTNNNYVLGQNNYAAVFQITNTTTHLTVDTNGGAAD